MRHHLRLMIIFVLAGAIVNVAVAWSFMRMPTWAQSHTSKLNDESVIDWWHKNAPTSFSISRYVRSIEWRSTANHHLLVSATPYQVNRYRIGWPLISLEGGAWVDSNQQPTLRNMVVLDAQVRKLVSTPILPMGMVWLGFVFNTTFYAVILWLIFASLLLFRRFRRIKRGLCAACSYPIGTSEVCTECGKPLGRRV